LFAATNGASSTLVAKLLSTSSLARTGFAKDDTDNENQRRTDSGDSYRTAVGDLHLTPSDASSLAGMKIQGGSS
jgi:hypothetical protein